MLEHEVDRMSCDAVRAYLKELMQKLDEAEDELGVVMLSDPWRTELMGE